VVVGLGSRVLLVRDEGGLADPGGVLGLLEEVGSGVGAGQPDTSFVPDGANVDLLGERGPSVRRGTRTIVQSRSEARTIWPMPTMTRYGAILNSLPTPTIVDMTGSMRSVGSDMLGVPSATSRLTPCLSMAATMLR
jgi:hypothetical protein